MGVGPRLLTGDPTRGAVGGGGLPIERRRQLQGDQRPARAAVVEVPRIDLFGVETGHPHLDIDPGRPQGGDAGPGHPGVGVGGTHHHPGDPGRGHRVDARWGAPVVGARLEGHHQSAVPGLDTRPGECQDLGVGKAGSFMGGDGDQAPTGREDHGADPRVGMGSEPGGGLHGALHSPQPWLRPTDSVVVGARRHHALLLPSGLSPSVPEFHRVHPWSRSGSVGVAGFHRRSGISPCPEGGSVADPTNATRRRRRCSGGHHGVNELRLTRCAGRSGGCFPGASWRVPSSRRRRRTPPIVSRAGGGHWWPLPPRVRRPGAAAPRPAGR